MGDQLVDEYLAFVAARARRNTWLAVASDLKIFFETVGKRPVEVTAADVFEFLTVQRRPRRGQNVAGLDGETGLAARTIARRLSSVRGKTERHRTRGREDHTVLGESGGWPARASPAPRPRTRDGTHLLFEIRNGLPRAGERVTGGHLGGHFHHGLL